jgi:penicillin-binding protein 1A
MLAGLPKAPSAFNPVANPKRAKQRQLYVLRRMHELGFINDARLPRRRSRICASSATSTNSAVRADYVAEMARQIAFERFQEEAYTRGLRVITTILKADQEAAYASLRRGVLDYDKRHGYRGAEGYADLGQPGSALDETMDEALQESPTSTTSTPPSSSKPGPSW